MHYGAGVTIADQTHTDLRSEAEAMAGSAQMPRRGDGEPVFDEPWHGRAVAMAIETVAALGLDWDAFRDELITAINDDQHRDYYESWLIALEALVAFRSLASQAQIDSQRLAAASYRTTEQNHDDLEVFALPALPEVLLELLTTIFEGHWRHVRFGPLIQGAVYELAATSKPRLSMLDGYLTIDLGGPHVHLCIGEQKGLPGHPVDPALAKRRRCAQIELQRQWIEGAPRTWMMRMFNGDGDQMLTILLPNPFLSDDQRLLAEPDWSRLSLWDQLRGHYLDLPADPSDRLGDSFVHA